MREKEMFKNTSYHITLHPKLIKQWKTVLTFLFLLFFSQNIFTQQSFNGLRHINKSQCLGLTTQHSSYSKAVNRILNLDEVKKWQKKLNANRKMALIPAINTPEFFKESCFWSISIYENAKDQSILWKIFLVQVDGSQIYYLSPYDGSYHPYSIK